MKEVSLLKYFCSLTKLTYLQVPDYFEGGLEVAYDFEAEAKFSKAELPEPLSKTFDIAKGKEWTKIFLVGPVPVQVFAKPTVQAKYNISKLSLDIDTDSKVTFNGTSSAKLKADRSTGITSEYNVRAKRVVLPLMQTVESSNLI